MCDYDQPILLYMLFIIIRFQLWSLIRTRLSLTLLTARCHVLYSFFSTAATLMSRRTGKGQEEAGLLRLTFVYNKSLLDSWKSIQREYAVYSGVAVSSIHSFSTRLSLSLLFFSPILPYLYYYQWDYTILSLRNT
ncbi:hypothetical protein HDV63DRAFT_176249 [Trichoderma sp. SZMC 28014]